VTIEVEYLPKQLRSLIIAWIMRTSSIIVPKDFEIHKDTVFSKLYAIKRLYNILWKAQVGYHVALAFIKTFQEVFKVVTLTKFKMRYVDLTKIISGHLQLILLHLFTHVLLQKVERSVLVNLTARRVFAWRLIVQVLMLLQLLDLQLAFLHLKHISFKQFIDRRG
jgi:hypothetical protein